LNDAEYESDYYVCAIIPWEKEISEIAREISWMFKTAFNQLYRLCSIAVIVRNDGVSKLAE
jgi:hypothetical protein